MVLSFWTDRPWQTVQTQIRLLLKEQSDQGLHCLSSCLHLLDKFLSGKTFLFKFSVTTANNLGFQKFRTFTVSKIIC